MVRPEGVEPSTLTSVVILAESDEKTHLKRTFFTLKIALV